MADKNIKSTLLEERTFPPPPAFAARARIKPADFERLRKHARADHVGFWAELASRELTWHTPFTQAFDDSEAPNYRWFADGRLNASHNCLDIHLAERGHKTAVIFEGEPGDVRRISYRELHAEVCRFANALKAQGIGRGDRVVIYMPLVPEILIAMHACNRIGAIHSVVFGGFSAPALKDRIEDTEARLVITADGGWRAGQAIELKAAADKALSSGCASVRARHRAAAHRQAGQHVRQARRVVARRHRGPARGVRSRVGRRRAPAVPAVYLRLHRQAEGCAALDRRLPARRQAHYAVGVRSAR